MLGWLIFFGFVLTAGAVVAWVASTLERPTAPLIAKAKQALERLRGEKSELAELWADDESSYASWLQTLEDVEQRLGS